MTSCKSCKWKLSNTNVELYNTNEMYKIQWKVDHVDNKLLRKYRIQMKVIECKWKIIEWRKTIQHKWRRSNIATFD